MHFFIPARLRRQVGVLVGMEAASSPTLSLIVVCDIRYKLWSWWSRPLPPQNHHMLLYGLAAVTLTRQPRDSACSEVIISNIVRTRGVGHTTRLIPTNERLDHVIYLVIASERVFVPFILAVHPMGVGTANK